jgi:hypothetical protein
MNNICGPRLTNHSNIRFDEELDVGLAVCRTEGFADAHVACLPHGVRGFAHEAGARSSALRLLLKRRAPRGAPVYYR